jgi:Hint module
LNLLIDPPHQPKRRRLNGKGKGSSDEGDDFYRWPCEFCGKGNDSALDPNNLACFSKDMAVIAMGKGVVKMDHLEVGDKILTEDGVFQSVYSFAHRDPNEKATFLKIHSDNGQPLELTHEHLVFLADKKNPVRAKSVKVGDVLKSATGNGKTATIKKIETVEKEGIYAPLTMGGSLVVNGVLASSYIAVQDTSKIENTSQSTLSDEYMILQGSKVQIPLISHHQFVDMAISPYRLVCRTVGSKFCDATKYIRDGMPLYVRLGLALTRLSNPNVKFHALFVVATVVLSSPFWLLERAVFLDHGVLNFSYLAVIMLTALTWIALKKFQVGFVAQKLKTA